MFKTLLIILSGLVVLTASFPAATVYGRVSGSIEMAYGGYRADESGSTVADVDYFAQKYSVLYSLSGNLVGGRGGRYDLALGGEWLSLTSESMGQDVDIESAKLLYRGEFLFAPGGLPIRFHAYSRDLGSALFEEDSLTPWQGDIFPYASRSVLEPRVYDDISDGSQIETGATLFVGIRNGHYLGKYRDIMSMFPRLLFDYHQIDVRDIKSLTPEKYRERDLAFVSLNKKDNWFHYRMHDYTDYLAPENNYREQSVMLGTVDHMLTRQWINMTNWIRVSADGSFTDLDAVGGQPDEQRFNLNLFTVGTRSNWDFSNFTTFERSLRGDLLSKNLEVPLFVKGNLNRDTGWRLRLIGEKRDDLWYSGSGSRSAVENALLDSRIEMFRTARYRVDFRTEFEYRTDLFGEGNAQRLGADLYSNKAYNPRYDLFSHLSVARFGGKDTSIGSYDYYEIELDGRVETSLTPRLRGGISDRVVVGQGDLASGFLTSYVLPSGQIEDTGSSSGQTGTAFRNNFTLFVEHSTRWRLRNRLELSHEYITAGSEDNHQITARHSLNFDRSQLAVRSTTSYTYFDKPSVVSTVGGPGVVSSQWGSARSELVYSLGVDYSPNRNWETTNLLDYEWREITNGGDYSSINFSHSLARNFYRNSGLLRKIASLEEEVLYEEETYGKNVRVSTLGVAVNLYPTRTLYLGSRVRYRYFLSDEQGEYAVYLMAGLNYEKLKINLDYAYGDREDSAEGVRPERVEHRWRVEVKKIF